MNLHPNKSGNNCIQPADPDPRITPVAIAGGELAPPQCNRVLLLCQHFYPEMISTGMHMTELASSLTRIGWDMTVYCARPVLNLENENQEAPSEMEYDGIRVVRVPSIGSHGGALWRRALFAGSYLLSSLWRVILTGHRFDVILATTNPPLIGLVARLATRLHGCPYLLIVYDVYPDIVTRLGVIRKESIICRLWERFSRYIMRGAAYNVVIGRDMAEIVSSKLGESNSMRLIPNWSNEVQVRPVPSNDNPFRKEHNPDNAWIVQYSGRMARTHNLECLIEAAEFLRHQNVVFQFIGDGAKKKALMQMTQEMHLTNVQFLPYQPIGKLGEVLSSADISIVCLESAYTGLSVPSKAYGIMASATPILGLLEARSEIGRVIEENNCGVVLQDPSGEQVAKVISDLVGDPGKLLIMGINGREAFQRDYTLSIAAKRYSHLMHEAAC